MIADAVFGAATGGVRALRFIPRASIPLEAACVVANGIRETLRELLGEQCELVLGEPTAIGGESWALLAHDAFLFLTRGRQTDIVLVLPHDDARRLVLRAFGEGDELPDGACSALELLALERIAARCAATFDPLCAERRGVSRAVGAHEVPACVAYFDVRVHAPIPLTLGIGIVRDLPDPGPSGALPRTALDTVAVEMRAVFAEGMLDASTFLRLRPGDVVRLDTKVGAPASLNIAGRRLGWGVAGVVATRTAFLVNDVAMGASIR
jgi:flagellar motor switch/type III secretory pathway protein FliN